MRTKRDRQNSLFDPEPVDHPVAEDLERASDWLDAVAIMERALGNEPKEVSGENRGYDIESRDPKTGSLRFIEVKGRAEGQDTVTISRNEILTGLNMPEAFILAIVIVADGEPRKPRYGREPFKREPDFGATSVTYKLKDLLARAGGDS